MRPWCSSVGPPNRDRTAGAGFIRRPTLIESAFIIPPTGSVPGVGGRTPGIESRVIWANVFRCARAGKAGSGCHDRRVRTHGPAGGRDGLVPLRVLRRDEDARHVGGHTAFERLLAE